MTRDWGASGIAGIYPECIDQDTRVQMELNLETNIPKEFFDDLGYAIGVFKAARTVADASTPAKVRKNITSLHKTVQKLISQMNELDANSKQLLNPDIEVRKIYDFLSKMYSATENAKNRADEYPVCGRLRELERIALAVDVRLALKKHLNIEATTTKSGAFDIVLSIVLPLATEGNLGGNNVHDLVRESMKYERAPSDQGGFLRKIAS